MIQTSVASSTNISKTLYKYINKYDDNRKFTSGVVENGFMRSLYFG